MTDSGAPPRVIARNDVLHRLVGVEIAAITRRDRAAIDFLGDVRGLEPERLDDVLANVRGEGGAGYARRPSAYERPRWEIRVKMDAGGLRTVSQGYEPALREGDRVRVYGTQLELAS